MLFHACSPSGDHRYISKLGSGFAKRYVIAGIGENGQYHNIHSMSKRTMFIDLLKSI